MLPIKDFTARVARATATRALCYLAFLLFNLFSLSLLAAPPAANDGSLDFAADQTEQAIEQALQEIDDIAQGVQRLKGQVVDLNRDLRQMEEKLLFPSSTKYTVFVTMATGRFFELESVKFKLDGDMVASHVYSDKQRKALSRGGVHQLYVTNLNEGKHNATVFLTGLGSNQRPYKRAVTLDFDKGPGSGHLEIVVRDNGESQEPAFELKQW